MSHNTPDFSRRANVTELTELMDEPCSRDEMRACLLDLARVNRWFGGYRPTLDWLQSLRLQGVGESIRIVDVGCGYGDTLRNVEQWARKQGIAVDLVGIDLNPDIIAIAAEASGPESRIRWIAGDVFDHSNICQMHLVMSSLFTHHLTDADVIRFIRWMERNAVIGWFINDLSRAPIPYYLFGWFARLVGLHRFVQHDGPVSFARAFQSEDWRRLCAAAGLTENEYRIESYKPARLCVSRRKGR
jgi:SAM-dependent methyltransferase